MATLATQSAKKNACRKLRQRAHKEEKIRQVALDFAKKLEGTPLALVQKPAPPVKFSVR